MFFFFFSSRRRHTRCYRDWSSDVCSSDLDGGRGDLRILRDRQAPERYAADDHEHDRHHGGEDRPVDEEMRDAHLFGSGAYSALDTGVRGCCASWGATLVPGRTMVSPLTMTRSSAESPSLTTRNPSWICPSVTCFCRAISSASTA